MAARRGYNKVFVLGSLFSCCLLTTLVVAACAALLWILSPTLLSSQVDKKVTIQEGHATYEQLHNLTLPLWKSFYFFNLTNREAFEAGSKPILEEVGPYSYREYRTKQFIEFSPDQQFLKYNQTKVFYFDKNATDPKLSESDIICTINIPLIAGADMVAGSSIVDKVEKKILEGIIWTSRAHLYVCKPASELAWQYTDNFIKDLHAVHKYPREFVNIQVNNSINDSYPSIIRTGVDDINLIGQFVQWDGHVGRLNTWKPPDSPCNMLNGTEGLFFHPNLKEGESLQAFVDDIQRSVDLVYVGKVKHLGVEAYRYEIANHTFLNVSQYPDNACWGPYEPVGVKTPQGLFYIGPTQYPEIPIYGSNPHFYGGDPSLLDCVEGLDPSNASDKVVKIDVEPVTGANIQLQKSLQLNVKVTKHDIKYLKNIQCVEENEAYYYPVLWLNEHAELTPGFKQYLENKGLKEVGMFNTLVPIVFGLLLALAVVLLCVSCCTCCCFVRASRKDLEEERQPLLHVNIDTNNEQ